MADLQVGSVRREDYLRAVSTGCSLSVVSNPDPSLIRRESWETADGITNEILCRVSPTLAADNNRREVIKYVRDLITGSLGCEIFPYGSVPLKTYLPDGDIDLTAISTPNIEDTLVSDVHAVLKGEENNKSAHYEVKDVHYIHAEVKLVKCLVQNIVVDISFNQLGGLCTLCFLELVDGIIGKDHLFKRSITLIKAWCYYESRILGAHHGLISTYALETLVLHVFHLFHSSLDGPLAVLYQFLDYFSKFDWENNCVSLNGPVSKSSVPGIVAKGPENGKDSRLLSDKFLQECFGKFSVPSRGMETNLRAFPQKNLNIIDVLNENNNLGRSINRGNSFRIRSAFKYGARKLGQALMLPNERLGDELNKFFANTLERHGNKYGTDVKGFAVAAEEGVSLKSSKTGYSNDKTQGFRMNQRRHSLKVFSSQAVPELNCALNRNAVSRSHHAGDAKVVATGILTCRNRYDSSSFLHARSDFDTSLLGKSQQAAHCNGKIENGSPPGRQGRAAFVADEITLLPESEENNLVAIRSFIAQENIAPRSSAFLTPVPNKSANSSSFLRERKLAINSDDYEPLKFLLDLSGHYESYFNNLTYAKHYHLSAPLFLSPTVSHQLQNNNLQDTICGSIRLESKACLQMNASGGLEPQFYSANPLMPYNSTFSSEDEKKSRGTGTYFPKMNFHSNGNMPLSGRRSFQAPGTYGQRHTHRNGLVTTSTETVLCGEDSYELSQEEFPILGNGKSVFLQKSSVWGSSKSHDFLHPPQKHERESYSFQPGEVPLAAVTTQWASDSSLCLDSASSCLEVPIKQSCDSVSESNEESNASAASFHLGNEVDFPPLSLQVRIKT